MELKTLKDFEFEQITDVRPDGYEGNTPGRKRIVKRRCAFSYHIREEMIKLIKELTRDPTEKERISCMGYGKLELDESKKSIRNRFGTIGVVKFIKYFFNIKEEELI